jgi:hypothetical protein
MTGAVVWKECREQWPTWLALALLAALSLAASGTLAGPADAEPFQRMVLMVAALGAGVVTGASLFAGEAEAGTLDFLDRLPESRSRLWRVKALAGAAAVAGQVAVLLLLAEWRGLLPAGPAGVLQAIVLVISAAYGYAWGLLTSAMCRTALGAVGVAVAVLVPLLVLVTAGVNALGTSPGVFRLAAAAFLVTVPVVPPVFGSWCAFAASDNTRRPDLAMPRLTFALGRSGTLAASLAALALAGGCLMPLNPQGVWAGLSLFLAAATGLATAERRGGWPQTVVGLLLAGGATGLLLMTGLGVQALADELSRTPSNPRTGEEMKQLLGLPPAAILLWPAHGFAAGHLFGHAFGRRMPSFLAAHAAALITAAPWLPPMSMGVRHWELALAVPAAAMTGAIVLAVFRPRRLVRGLVLAWTAAAVAVALAGALAWRKAGGGVPAAPVISPISWVADGPAEGAA